MRRNFQFKIVKEGKGRTARWRASATYESLLLVDGHYKWMLIKAIGGQKFSPNTDLIMAVAEIVGKSAHYLDMIPTRISVIEENVTRQVILKSTNENAGFYCFEDTGDSVGSICFV